MPMTAEQTRLRATVAGMAMLRDDDDPELVELRRQLAEANRRARAERAVRKALLTLTLAERRELLAELAEVGMARPDTTPAAAPRPVRLPGKSDFHR